MMAKSQAAVLDTGRRAEMSRYIDLDAYHAVERTHPFYEEMLARICELLATRMAALGSLKVLEVGAGTGLATAEFLIKIPGIEIEAVEIDPHCFEALVRHIGDRISAVNGDAVSYCREGQFDAVVSVFAHDHIRPEQAPDFVANIRRNLRPGGLYLMGGEILPHYESDGERHEALLRYHGFIVLEALRQGHYALSKLEIDALESGIRRIGDFKRHEQDFEAEMDTSSLRLMEKTKLGPLDRGDVGGVFVYGFEAV